MFAVTPYSAEYQTFTTTDEGRMESSWHACRVVGITRDEHGEPGYLVEVGRAGTTHLQVEPYIRHRG